ncbi:unnamed protein product [Scytosiphon promiscuus]
MTVPLGSLIVLRSSIEMPGPKYGILAVAHVRVTLRYFLTCDVGCKQVERRPSTSTSWGNGTPRPLHSRQHWLTRPFLPPRFPDPMFLSLRDSCVTHLDDDGYLTASPTLATPAPVTPRGPRAPTPVMPVAPPTPAPTPEAFPTASPAPATESPAESTSTTSTSEGSPTPADFSELLELHNEARCMHNADPLTWSDAVANSAALHAETLEDSCSELFHSDSEDRLGYGENLYVCWGSDTCYSHEKAMTTLYNEEVESDTVAEYGGHATQILWKSTTALGCVFAECTHGNTPYTYLICQYDPVGNVEGELAQEVELPSASGSC